MARNIIATFMFCVLMAWALSACDSGQTQQPQQVQLPPAQPMPIQQPVAQPAPVAPPATPLIPLSEEQGEAVATTGTKSKGTTKPKIPSANVDEVDVPLPGNKIEGDELIGNYACQVDADGLPTGPFKLPAIGCRIYRAEDGTLKLGPTTKNIAALKGNIQSPTDAGYLVVGGFKFPGNQLNIKTRMQRQAGANVVYAGKGKGTLNDGGKKISYMLTMTKK